MKRAVGALERTGGFTIPGAVPQADIKRAFGPKLTASHTISLSPTFNHTPARRIAPKVLLAGRGCKEGENDALRQKCLLPWGEWISDQSNNAVQASNQSPEGLSGTHQSNPGLLNLCSRWN